MVKLIIKSDNIMGYALPLHSLNTVLPSYPCLNCFTQSRFRTKYCLFSHDDTNLLAVVGASYVYLRT
jgi:hypothetical protein